MPTLITIQQANNLLNLIRFVADDEADAKEALESLKKICGIEFLQEMKVEDYYYAVRDMLKNIHDRVLKDVDCSQFDKCCVRCSKENN